MLKQKPFVKLLGCLLVLFFVLTVILYGLVEHIYDQYQRKEQERIASVLGPLIEEYPQLEGDIVTYIFSLKEDKEAERRFMEKYQLNSAHILPLLERNGYPKRSIFYFYFRLLCVLFGSVTLLFSLYFYRQHKKINELDVYMNRVLNGDYSIDIHDYKEGSISNLKNDIYKITVRLKEQHEKARQDNLFLEETLSDISHQLKTPLTSMYVIQEVLSKENLDVKTKKEFLAKNEIQLERIEWLVTSLLKLSRLDSGSAQIKKEEVLVSKLIEASLEPIKIPMELKHQSLQIEGSPNLTAFLDFHWTVEAFVNILKNAHEHTACGGTIQISYQDNPLYTYFAIQDNGSGIQKEDLPHIFERFYKGSHNSKESIGIGLNLSKKVIEKQGGEITVKSTLGEGTTFMIKFYKQIV